VSGYTLVLGKITKPLFFGAGIKEFGIMAEIWPYYRMRMD
jgi:hypothetical protein